GDFFRNTVIEKLLLKSTRILSGIRRFRGAVSLSASTVGKAVSLPRSSCFYAVILTCLSIPKVFAADSIPLSDSQQKFVNETAAPFLARFYDELRKRGIDVVDLAPVFLQNRAGEHGPVFCKTDSHWSGFGCVLAAQTIKEKIHEKLAGQPRKNYAAEWKETTI